MDPLHAALAILLTPLAAALVIALFLRRRGALAAGVSVAAAGAVCALALPLVFSRVSAAGSLPWLELGSFSVALGFKLNPLALLMLFVVACVGFLIHVFSLGYLRDDPARARYFGGLSIFMFSMLGIVLADSLVMIFLFWELVGFSSWLLIGHWYERPAAAAAAKKAFIVNRVGDFGFLLGIVWCQWTFGTTNLDALGAAVGEGGFTSSLLPLLLFCGAMGKSAQLPLHVWLPDAMEGPTPVSALIHAATMVAAGIYLLCRIHFLMNGEALQAIACVGTVTALYAAVCALVQTDIKKVLAYSTLSQLGYMVAAFGLGSLAGGPDLGRLALPAGAAAAMFHLTTHAFFKALLFLGAGAVIHGCHHEQDIFRLGGLRRTMPFTFWMFTVGVAALIGVPFLAGFYSKDAILYLALENSRPVFGVLAFTAILTAGYMVRLWKLVFFGAARSASAAHAHEGPWTLRLPLLVLAVLAVASGGDWAFAKLAGELQGLVPHAHGRAHLVVLLVSVGVLATGAGLAWALYRAEERDTLAARFPAVFQLLGRVVTSFDQVYDYYVAKVQQRFALLLNFLEQIFLAGLLVRGLAGFTGLVGLGVRALHVGNLHAYVYWFLLGVALFWAVAAGG